MSLSVAFEHWLGDPEIVLEVAPRRQLLLKPGKMPVEFFLMLAQCTLSFCLRRCSLDQPPPSVTLSRKRTLKWRRRRQAAGFAGFMSLDALADLTNVGTLAVVRAEEIGLALGEARQRPGGTPPQHPGFAQPKAAKPAVSTRTPAPIVLETLIFRR